MIQVTRFMVKIAIAREVERGEREHQREVDKLRAEVDAKNIALQHKIESREEDINKMDPIKTLDSMDAWG